MGTRWKWAFSLLKSFMGSKSLSSNKCSSAWQGRPCPFSVVHEIHVGLAQMLLHSATGVSIQFLRIFIIQKPETFISTLPLGGVKGCELWEELTFAPPGFTVFLKYQPVRSRKTWEKLFPDLYTFGVKDFTYLFSTFYVFYMYNFIQLK